MTTDPNASQSSSAPSESSPSSDGHFILNRSTHNTSDADFSASDAPQLSDISSDSLAGREVTQLSLRKTESEEYTEEPLTTRISVSASLAVQPDSPQANALAAKHQPQKVLILVLAIAIMVVGLAIGNRWVGLAGSIVALLISAQILWLPLRGVLLDFVTEQERMILLGSVSGGFALLGLLTLIGFFNRVGEALARVGWDAIGALGEVLGAVGQILIALLAVYIAWRQYIISRDLTIQQNTITQQQTIDSYFQGVSELVLDEEGLLEDWPQERAIAEGRTAAILGSVDAGGKAKVIRFLSRARLLTPLRRDRRLGRVILDGRGGYEEDRLNGVRVIDLGVMLARADLKDTDLRWTDLSEANLIQSNLSRCDLVKANLSRTILCSAKLRKADLNGTRFFYGKAESASPRSRTEPPDYRSGKHTGAVIEDADFTGVVQLSDEQRQYCCAWGGAKTRSTIPGGCAGIPNKLGR